MPAGAPPARAWTRPCPGCGRTARPPDGSAARACGRCGRGGGGHGAAVRLNAVPLNPGATLPGPRHHPHPPLCIAHTTHLGQLSEAGLGGRQVTSRGCFVRRRPRANRGAAGVGRSGSRRERGLRRMAREGAGRAAWAGGSARARPPGASHGGRRAGATGPPQAASATGGACRNPIPIPTAVQGALRRGSSPRGGAAETQNQMPHRSPPDALPRAGPRPGGGSGPPWSGQGGEGGVGLVAGAAKLWDGADSAGAHTGNTPCPLCPAGRGMTGRGARDQRIPSVPSQSRPLLPRPPSGAPPPPVGLWRGGAAGARAHGRPGRARTPGAPHRDRTEEVG